MTRKEHEMKITKRDIEILNFINEMGYCKVIQIGKRFSLKTPRVYKIMKRLREEGLAIHKRIYFYEGGVLRLTRQGAAYTSLPAFDHIAKGTYDHQLLVVDVYLVLREKYLTATWISERVLRQDKPQYGIGKMKHISDGFLIFNEKKIAIELELTMKKKERLERIIRSYGSQTIVDEVWYICGPGALQGVKAIAQKKSFIKVLSLKELLNE